MMNRFVVLAGCVMAVLSLQAERQSFDRYQTIVDRQMFGPLPDGFDPTKPPSEVQKTSAKSQKELTKEQEQIKKSVKFSMINLNPKGETMVGFTDNSDPKNVRHYYLKVGDTRDGWTVKSADAVTAKVSISKDGVDLDLELGAGSGGGSPAATAGKGAAPSNGVRGFGGIGARRGGIISGGSLLGGSAGLAGSLRERRMAKMQQREADEKAAAEDQAKREAEAAEAKAKEEEEKAKRDAERDEQRQQLQAIQEELKKAREARQAREADKEGDDSDATNEE